jgi:anti-sigma-K factor RskA
MNEKDFAELSAGAAVNALTADERRAFDTALSQHPEWSHHVQADADTVASLSASVPPITPPPAVRAALLASLAHTPQGDPDAATAAFADDEDYAAEGVAPVVAPAGRAHSGASRRWFTLAASVVLVAVLGIGTVTFVQQVTRPPAVVALAQIADAPDAESASFPLENGGEATAHWSAELGQAVLVSDGLPTLADDQTFELWFVRDAVPVSAGTFDSTDSTALLAGAFHSGDVIAVTVEQEGGSPSGQPTSTPIVAIPTV